MDKPINNIHDKFVKDMLSDREMAIAFLEGMLPASVLKHINLESLTYANTSYITPELEEIFSDMVLDFDLKQGKPIRISILIEHKSYIDEQVTVQLLRYLGEAYTKQLLAKVPLRPIIPLIYYHGSRKWKFKQFSHFFEEYPSEIFPFLPLFESLFVNLSTLDEEHLSRLRNSMLHAALEVQRYQTDPEKLLKRLYHIAENLNPYLNTGFAIKLLIYLLQTTEVSIEDFKEKLPPETMTKVMSTYDRILAEGIEKGRAEGIENSILGAYDKGYALSELSLIFSLEEKNIRTILIKNNRKIKDV